MKKILLSLFMYTSALANEPYQIIQDKSNLPLLNPSLQKRKTAKLCLNNGLEVYLISDELADQSAAALSIKTGSWQDPEAYPGTAHFLEHMLFMGTKKYPDEDAFDRFIKDNGGECNAYTASDHTVYSFSIHHPSFDQAIDYFSHFFIDPLFNPSSVARELQAVEQEYAKNIENDAWRRYMICKELGNPDHPNRWFSIGNAQTLSKIPQDELRKWYQENYSANLMKLVVYSPKPIDTLKKLITDTFSEIPNRKVEPFTINKPLSSDQQLGHFIYIQPVKNIQHLYLDWELPASFAVDETKTAELLAYTINQGQKNSLLEILKKEGLAENLQASTGKIGHHNALFEIDITLTDQGVAQMPLVMQRCFETLAGLRNMQLPTYLFEEMRKVSKRSYQYQTRKDPFAFVMDHARDLLYESLATYPAKTVLPSSYRSEKFQSLLQVLQPENGQYYIVADSKKTKVATDQKEKWMGGAYAVRKVPEALLLSWKTIAPNPHIALPQPNPFMPSKLALLPKHKELAPVKIVDNKKGKVFYFKDNLYDTPEVVHLMHIKSPLIDGTAQSASLMDLYLQFSKDKLSPILSCAAAAGLEANFGHARNSFKITISGFSDKAAVLLKEILKELQHHTPQKRDFDLYISKLSKIYENAAKQLPIQQAIEKLCSLLQKTNSTSKEKLTALHRLTYEDFLSFHSKLFEKSYIEGFFSGNLTRQEAKRCWLDMQHILGYAAFPKHLHPKEEVLCLADQGPFVVEEKTTAQGNGIILTIDQGPFSFEKQAAQGILSIALQEAFFTTLRTKQKTGYIVQSLHQEIEKRLFQCFGVQSNSHQCQDLLYRFELFLEDFLQEMPHDISAERFEKIRANYLLTLENLFPNLQDKSAWLDTFAFERNGDFNWLEKRMQAAKKLTYDQFVEYANQFLSRANRKRLALSVSGKLPENHNFTYKEIEATQILKHGKYLTNQ